MADSAPPKAKKAKRSVPVIRLSAEERAKQFKDDLYADSRVLFVNFVLTALIIPGTRVDTIKDHLKSTAQRSAPSSPKKSQKGQWQDHLQADKSLS